MAIATVPLEPQDVELLRRVGAGSRFGQTTLAVGSVLLAGCAGAFFSMGRETASAPALSLAMYASGLVVLLATPGLLWFVRRRNLRAAAAIDERIAQGQKFIVQGMLREATAVVPGRVRYVVDGHALDTFPVLGLDTPGSHVPGRMLRTFTALANTPVELHCVGWNQDAYLLLRAHYPQTRQPVRSRRAATAADRRRAGRANRRFVAFVALGLGALVLVIAWQSGFDASLTAFIGGYMALVWALVLALSALPGWLRARRLTHWHTVQGPVTEILVSPVSTGKNSVDASWYRIDGQTFSSFDVGGTAQLGNQATIEWLGSERGEDGGRVVSLQRSAPGAGA
ncbi:MAG: hypothetical protein EOP80_11990 [Variovorax sp.]|nr:MAG: hypothetical protein EOP80_11990 [Variovorax sp.]